MATKNNYYAVRVGRTDNTIVDSWYECERLVKGYPGAIFKGYKHYEQAQQFITGKAPKWGRKRKPMSIHTDPVSSSELELQHEHFKAFIPATTKKDKFGYYKPRYYSLANKLGNSVRMADYGRTIGHLYVPDLNNTSCPF